MVNDLPAETGGSPKKKVGGTQDRVWKIALAGFGTVGKSVARILLERPKPCIRLTHICNRNVARKKVDWIPADVVWTESIDFKFTGTTVTKSGASAT